MKEPVYCTIFCDASYKDRKGGWGCWVKCGFVKFQSGGPIHFCESSNHAELIAACEALSQAYLRGAFPALPNNQKHVVVFGIDSKHVINLINNGAGNNKIEREIIQKMLELKKLVGFEWRAKHVKAHSGTGHPRKWVNNLCDQIARQHREAISR